MKYVIGFEFLWAVGCLLMVGITGNLGWFVPCVIAAVIGLIFAVMEES